MTIHVNLPEKMPTRMAPYLIQPWPLFESVRGELAHLDKILESTLGVGLKGIVTFCHPLQVANFSLLLVQNSLRYVNTMTFESILSICLFKTGVFQRIKK